MSLNWIFTDNHIIYSGEKCSLSFVDFSVMEERIFVVFSDEKKLLSAAHYILPSVSSKVSLQTTVYLVQKKRNPYTDMLQDKLAWKSASKRLKIVWTAK